MSEPRDARPEEADRRGRVMLSAGFDEYVAARERYFEQLRIDSEIHRLEKSWRMPAFGLGSDEGATV